MNPIEKTSWSCEIRFVTSSQNSSHAYLDLMQFHEWPFVVYQLELVQIFLRLLGSRRVTEQKLARTVFSSV